MPRYGILFAFVALLACVSAGEAQNGDTQLSFDRLGDIQTGSYTVSNGATFTLDRYDDKYLMRFGGEPEIYVLYVDHGSLGGRVLKYDSGGTAMQVSGWGALTIYTDAQPGGLPAEHSGGSTMPAPAQVTLGEMQNAANDESEHLAYVRSLHIAFDADWPALAADAALRAITFDAMQNAARGIDRFAAIAAGRIALAAKMDTVRMVSGGRPTIALQGRTLLVTFVPAKGLAGRASSHGIARALGQLFSVPTAG
ncbi:MAG TPA: DUF4908 domain-containing protein [Rhizomicrobium sp.]|jgi:hypothetical protein|nr:DUF4908 domain-containing protein [Rhizomicrobium sp.]